MNKKRKIKKRKLTSHEFAVIKNSIRRRLKIICANNGLTRLQLIEKHYGGIIPDKMKSPYSVSCYLRNLLTPKFMQNIPVWVYKMIEFEEKNSHENGTN